MKSAEELGKFLYENELSQREIVEMLTAFADRLVADEKWAEAEHWLGRIEKVRNEALEEAAGLAEFYEAEFKRASIDGITAFTCRYIAKDIRARKSKPEVKPHNSGEPWRHEYGSKEYWRDSE